jgi:hypothetical protein
MSQPVFVNRATQSTQTSGTGTIELIASAAGFQDFRDHPRLSNGGEMFYCILDDADAPEVVEVGRGTLTVGATDTLSRDTIYFSTNSNSAVSLDGQQTYIVSGTVPAIVLNAIIDTMMSDLTTTGSADAYEVDLYRPEINSVAKGVHFRAFIHETNTGASTIVVNGEPAVAIKLVTGGGKTDTYEGALQAGEAYDFYGDGTHYICLNPSHKAPVRRIYTSSDDWDRPDGLLYVRVQVWGGGGGGGGCGTGGSGIAATPGGSAGGYSEKVIAAASLGSTETVTIGAAGAAGDATGSNGGTGGTSSFGAHCSASGGAGGAGMATRSTSAPFRSSAPPQGGLGSSGDRNQRGGSGDFGVALSTSQGYGGQGGSVPFGGVGGSGRDNSGNPSHYDGQVPGGGGGGGCSTGGLAVGAGARGEIIVEEFYS